jgi:hypothetical protein
VELASSSTFFWSGVREARCVWHRGAGAELEKREQSSPKHPLRKKMREAHMDPFAFQSAIQHRRKAQLAWQREQLWLGRERGGGLGEAHGGSSVGRAPTRKVGDRIMEADATELSINPLQGPSEISEVLRAQTV